MAPSWRSSPNGHSTTNGNAEKKQPADVNWDELGFSLTPTDYMYVMRCGSGESCFSEGTLLPFGNIEMNPCSAILNYGQGLFEGLKAYRKEDGKLLLFRLEQNTRTEYGAKVDGVCRKLHTRLTGIQTGQVEDTMGWTVAVN